MIKNEFALSDNNLNSLIEEDLKKEMKRIGYSDNESEQVLESIVGILNKYTARFGEGTQIEYYIKKRLKKLYINISIPGEEYNPIEDAKDNDKFMFRHILNLNLESEVENIYHRYIFDRNVIVVSIPIQHEKRKILKNPIIWSVILGVLVGFLVSYLPDGAKSFILEDVVSPVNSTVLSLIAGIMGPVILISLLNSIIAIGNVNDLTNLGFKIVGRFVVSTLFIAVVSTVVGGLFYGNFGQGNVDFSPKLVVDMIIDLIPVNFLQSFLDNNTPQIVIIGFLLGIALLIVGDKAKGINDLVGQVNSWIMSIMNIILMVIPAIPFLGIVQLIGKGQGAQLLQGWKYIVASYVIYTIIVVVKFIKVLIRTKIKISDLFKICKPIIFLVFTTGSTSSALSQVYDVSEKGLHIDNSYTSFWIPMCSAMLSVKTTVNVILAAFMVASITGTPVSVTFLFAMFIIAVELSLASPGTTSSWTVMLKSMSMSTDYVGILTVYRLFTANYGAASTEAYCMLEEIESAYTYKKIDVQKIGKEA